MSKKKQGLDVHAGGPRCFRCGKWTMVYERVSPTPKMLAAPFYYRRFFRCVNKQCKTTLIMPDEFRVWNQDYRAQVEREVEQMVGESEQLGGYTDGPPPWA